MSVNTIARLMHLATQAYLRQEIPVGEYTTIVQALAAQAREAGIGEEAQAVYNQMCQDSLRVRAT